MRTFDIHTGAEIMLLAEANSETGQIRHCGTKKPIKATPDKDGYPTIRLRPVDPGFYPRRHKTKDKWLNKRRVHRLFYETFIGRIPPGEEIDHNGFQRFDCRLESIRAVPWRINRKRHYFNQKREKHIQGELL